MYTHFLEGLSKRITLKALANVSPGLRLGNPGTTYLISRRRNSEGVAPGIY